MRANWTQRPEEISRFVSSVNYSQSTNPVTVAPTWGEDKMEFTALFLAVAVTMLAAWKGSRTLAQLLFAAVLIACVATYLHHATDTLTLSF